MVDVCAWCECFSRHRLSPAAAAAATAYLFKVPEGAALGATDESDSDGIDAPDPGFFYQMKSLHDTLAALAASLEAVEGTGAVASLPVLAPAAEANEAVEVMGDGESASTESATPTTGARRPKPGVVCAGLACLDMQLIGATKTKDPQAVNAFQQVSFCAGGSAPQVSCSTNYIALQSPPCLNYRQAHLSPPHTTQSPRRRGRSRGSTYRRVASRKWGPTLTPTSFGDFYSMTRRAETMQSKRGG